ncbi:RNase adapter RapZ [Baekduia soli]|uniref:RNase adapter RapZ n=1 Tax=Baekduia soli TaxID=496014 RepID=A0A5B8U4T7_9ACTN|nr:RNase adapter RapZ [Baekduia soli]QEC47868.1 RNase adapter RapZ [Baekduia soli]
MEDTAENGRPGADTRLEDLVVISGYSGAGKSTAMAVFEDAGYFCVDNLPPEMIRSLVELFTHEGSKVERAAVVSDVRGGEFFEPLEGVIEDLQARGLPSRVLFLDADDLTLMDRYKETRRRHPLSPEGSIAAGIAAERTMLGPIKDHADFIIDSSGLKASHLRRRIADELLPRSSRGRLAVTFQSFGFKHGPPRDADLVFDVRFLPNPHYVPELRPLTGLDPRIVEYVGREGKLEQLYLHLVPLLEFLVPQYEEEGKSHLSLAVGCTGGRHRSVAIIEHLARHFGGRDDVVVEVEHRDVGRKA